jgi:protein required for attachment to host cells
MMATTMVVVAHQAGARFLVHKPGFGKNLTFVRELKNPDGRKKNGELDSDRSDMAKQQSSHERQVANFARELAQQIQLARLSHELDELILVADPHFLGTLESALDRPTHHTLKHKVSKDLCRTPTRDIASHISDVLPL